METSEQLNELAAALAKAQGQIKGAKKDAENPFFKSKYATLDAVWDACREPLSANGLAVVQGVSTPHEATVCITTLLVHTSGQWVRDSLTMPAGEGSPQDTGSATTYARRYGLSAMVGVAPEDDNDAQGLKAGPRRDFSKGPVHGPAAVNAGLPPVAAPTPQQEAATAKEAQTLFRTYEEQLAVDERAALLEEATRLAKVLKLSAAEKKAFLKEHLGKETADIFTADITALRDMVADMAKRAPRAS